MNGRIKMTWHGQADATGLFLLLFFVLLSSIQALSGQGSATLDITYPDTDGNCTGTITLIELQDCGVPGANAWINSLADLPLEEEVTGFCPGALTLMISDTSGFASEHRLLLSADSTDGLRTFAFECFDSSYYSPDILIYSQLKDYETSAILIKARVTIVDDKGRKLTYSQENSRPMEFVLPIDRQYTLTFDAEGYYTKILEINGNVSDPWAVGPGFEMEIAMNMLPIRVGIALDLLKEAMNTAVYDPDTRQFIWDQKRALSVKALIDSLYHQR